MKDHDGRIAHLIKIVEEYPYDGYEYDDRIMGNPVIKFHNRFTGEYEEWDTYTSWRAEFNHPIAMTKRYNDAIFRDCMFIALSSDIPMGKIIDADKMRGRRSQVYNQGYDFDGWAVDVEFLKEVLKECSGD